MEQSADVVKPHIQQRSYENVRFVPDSGLPPNQPALTPHHRGLYQKPLHVQFIYTPDDGCKEHPKHAECYHRT